MKEIKDNFSKQADSYKKFRPTYPLELYDCIYEHCQHFDHAWDCGTGNGQVAVQLAEKFSHVSATDVSQRQLDHASKASNIHYSCQRAEKTTFQDHSFALITVGQAAHWFDLPRFFEETKRVLQPGGLMAMWTYDLVRTEVNEIDQAIHHFYTQIVGEYWDAERSLVDEKYATIHFPLNEIKANKEFAIGATWQLSDLEGFLNSWSAVAHYIKANKTNPVTDFIHGIERLWPEPLEVSFPIHLRMGRFE